MTTFETTIFHSWVTLRYQQQYVCEHIQPHIYTIYYPCTQAQNYTLLHLIIYCRECTYNKINFHLINFPPSQVSGILHNTGQSLVFRVDKDTKQHVNISGGPLAYRYQFEEIYIHYGTENSQGSEHHINGYSFPGEVSAAYHNII